MNVFKILKRNKISEDFEEFRSVLGVEMKKAKTKRIDNQMCQRGSWIDKYEKGT